MADAKWSVHDLLVAQLAVARLATLFRFQILHHSLFSTVLEAPAPHLLSTGSFEMSKPDQASASAQGERALAVQTLDVSSAAEWDVTGLRSARKKRSHEYRSRAVLTLAQPSWLETIQANAPAILIGVGVAAIGAFLIHRILTRPASRGNRKRRGGLNKKLKIPSEFSASAGRTHGLIVDDPNTPRIPVGLRNVGNSCFLNALLQALQSSEPFVQYLVRLQSLASQLHALSPALVISSLQHSQTSLASTSRMYPSVHPARRPLEFLSALLQLLIGGATGAALNPLPFYNLLVAEASGKFAGFDQQDAHELFAVLMDLLERKASDIQSIKQAVLDTAAREGFEALLPKSKPITAETAAPAPVAVDSNSTFSTSGSESENTHQANGVHPVTESSPSDASSPPLVSISPPASSPSPSPLLSSLLSPAFLVPSDPFRGMIAHFLLCKTCMSQSSSVRHNEFNSVTLHFEGRGAGSILNSNGNDLTLESLLRNFVQTEAIDGVRCEQCKWSERMTQIKMLRSEADHFPVKGGKSQKKKTCLFQLLDEAEEVTRDRLLLLQPTSGEYLKRKREERMQQELKEMQQRLRGEITASSSPSSNSVENDEFLSSSTSSDPLLSTASPAPSTSSTSSDSDASVYFQQLSSRLHEESSDGSDLSAQLPSGFDWKLQQLCAIDVKRTFAKGSAIARLPPSICFHLARLLGGAQSKVTAHVEFPLRFSLERFTADWVHGEQSAHVALSASGLNAGRFLASQQLRSARALDPSESRGMAYELDAVVVHQGGGAGGHYVAYRRQVQRHMVATSVSATPTQEMAPKLEKDGDEVHVDAPTADVTSDSTSASVAPVAAFSLPSPDSPTALSTPAPIITWWYASDAEIHQVDVEEVLRAQAYLLIYTQMQKA